MNIKFYDITLKLSINKQYHIFNQTSLKCFYGEKYELNSVKMKLIDVTN